MAERLTTVDAEMAKLDVTIGLTIDPDAKATMQASWNEYDTER